MKGINLAQKKMKEMMYITSLTFFLPEIFVVLIVI